MLEALHKEPERRYASASALADDLDAVLAGLPIRAGRTSEWGRVVRFVRRQRWIAAAVLAGLGAAIAWGGWMVRESWNLRRELERAAVSSARSRDAMATTLDRLTDDESAIGDAASLRRDLLTEARRYYHDRAVDAESDKGPEAAVEAADAVTRVAAIDGALGGRAEAVAGFRTAVDLWKSLAVRHLGDPSYAERLAEARAGLGRALDPGARAPKAGAETEAEAETEAALTTLDAAREGYLALADALPDEPRIRRRLARVLHDQAEIHRRRGDDLAALGALRPAIRLLEELNWAEPGRLETRIELASAFGLMARIMGTREDGLASAAIALDRAVSLLDATPPPDGSSPRVASDTAARLIDMADLHRSAGEIKTAVDALTRATALLENLAARFPADASYRAELASAYNLDAEMLRDRGRRPEATARAEKAQALLERLIVEQPEEPRHAGALAFTRQLRGRMLAQDGRFAEALKAFQSAADLLEGRKDRAAADSYALACNLSLGLTLIGVKEGGRPIEDADDPSLTPTDRLRRDVYARRAVSALRQAVAGGYDRYEVYRQDPALDPLRSREDFKKLLADLAAKSVPATPAPAG
ncbi:hypothetical protein [Planctomyces sp. SH-PL62]|uniref:hypothetical protein n=1 Tax=Planctomyces sp. SH-PL62 TaxID=1636152 RepID=UPI00078E30E3|nr:hypothetical protein [Planctomyces sp. SH-PL62]AMV40135.1 hypothetical protein VT85_22065 [Planctomyces sp. SH-PL62]